MIKENGYSLLFAQIQNMYAIKSLLAGNLKKVEFENALPDEWKNYISERVTFFRTDLGGRIVKVRVHFKPKDEGYITWYLAIRQAPIEKEKNKKWATPWRHKCGRSFI